jgi:hypothetical protein
MAQAKGDEVLLTLRSRRSRSSCRIAHHLIPKESGRMCGVLCDGSKFHSIANSKEVLDLNGTFFLSCLNVDDATSNMKATIRVAGRI